MRLRLTGTTRSFSSTPPAGRRTRSFLVAAFALVAAAALTPAAASGANEVTLDRNADSSGPVVMDESGNGYVAWLHKGSPDTVMFCKLAPESHKCASPLTLPVTLKEPPAATDTPFPILGPENTVFVVAPSYDTAQMVMWESTNGGASFGPAYVGPGNSVNLSLKYSDTCNVGTDLDDVMLFNADGAQYDRSQGLTTVGSGGVSAMEFEMSSSDPFAYWSFDFYGSGCYAPSSLTLTPGVLPVQWFGFGDEGIADGGIGTDQTTLGWATGGTAACARVTPGDDVEVYALGSEPETLQFFRWSAPSGPCGGPEKDLGPSAAHNWSGPTTVTQGTAPRLAGGKSGLFLLSGDELSARTHAPSGVDIRQYDVASHDFGAAKLLTHVSNPSGLDPNSGGLGESYTSGELAAVWPDTAGDTGTMSLFISTDGGARFSSAQDIAQIAHGYAGPENARVAVAPNGTGLVTWEDDGGLHVADFDTLASPYKRLRVHHHRTIELPVTCEAPKGSCRASASLEAAGQTIASSHVKIGSGLTATLRLVLNSKGQELLSHAKHHLGATLKLTITHPGASSERLGLHTVLVV